MAKPMALLMKRASQQDVVALCPEHHYRLYASGYCWVCQKYYNMTIYNNSKQEAE